MVLSFRLAFSPLVSLSFILALATPGSLHAANIDEAVPTAQVLAQLEQRASTAPPRDQCFLYTELVHVMTEKAGSQLNSGDTEGAAATFKQIDNYAHLIHIELGKDTKRLKSAEMLMHHTTYKLGEYLHLVSGDDKVTVQATLTQLDQVNDEILTQVFRH